MSLSALVVGRGRMGRFHERVLADLGYQTVTVDPDPAKNADHASIAEATLATRPITTIKPRFDVTCIATPAEYLLDSAYQLAGTPMLVEKPFALTSQNARMLGSYLKDCGAPVCVGYVERFNPVVRELRARLHEIERARFVRWSDRPSWNPDLDLLSHDVDLALHLGLLSVSEFDVHANRGDKARIVEAMCKGEYVPNSVTFEREPSRRIDFDLMAHDQSPLHAMWHAFLTGKPVPTPEEAARVLSVIEHMARTEEAVAA